MKYSELLKMNRLLGKELKSPPYQIAVLSNTTINQLKEILEYTLRENNINALVTTGEYDNIVQDSQKLKSSHAVVVFLEAANIIDGLQYKLDLMETKEVEALISRVEAEIDLIFKYLEQTPIVIFNLFSSTVFNFRNIRQNEFDRFCESLNNYVQKHCPINVQLVNINAVISKVSVRQSFDFRYYYSSKALYTIDFYQEYSEYVRPIILSTQGIVKKALILDCDNTLWKGILGEDGITGIQMSSQTKEGVVFEEVQSLALELNRKGVLLVLCSKNNPEDIDEVLKNHPDMQIRDEHITLKQINWEEKAANIKAIKEELNIGFDSLVFIDDSDFEVNLVREQLPEVTVIQVPKKLHSYPAVMRDSMRLFYSFSKTSEDLKKVWIYKQQRQRKESKSRFADIEDYLASLEMKVKIHVNDLSLIPRMSQMTQKTNQFNLTTKRYSEAEIRNFISDPESLVFAFEVTDRFGDNGITGLCICCLNNSNTVIDSYLMSCRIIGRNVEFVFFDFLVKFLKQIGIKNLHATYLKTLKNPQVSCLYDRLGFILINNSESGREYKLDLSTYQPTKINYVEILHGNET